MNSKILLAAAGVVLMATGLASTACAFGFRGGAHTSVNRGDWQSNRQANVATRQSNMTTRQSNRQSTRQNTVENVSNNRANTAQNISNNRTNTVNNYYNNGYHGGGWYNDYPVATAAAVTATAVVTAAAVGSIVNSVPPSCSAVSVNGMTYQQCGSTWYQPQYAGTTVQYVVVNPPR
jgi:hypothetical protein